MFMYTHWCLTMLELAQTGPYVYSSLCSRIYIGVSLCWNLLRLGLASRVPYIRLISMITYYYTTQPRHENGFHSCPFQVDLPYTCGFTTTIHTITLTHITHGTLKHPYKHVIYTRTSHTSIPCHGQQKTCVSFFDR